jgi:hypothetical protein
MVVNYLDRLTLSKIGYSFDEKALSDFDVRCFSIISSKWSEIEIRNAKQMSNK